ncbi:MAG: hypothetical protein KatS3mg129_0469 [Leptospiraceae bacterium]|nr:MAG: hypothetical protein KatS3mg129_0469 [Leptospiraceae bacterium]
MKIIYLHGFASSPKSSKAEYFKRQFKILQIPIEVPDLNCNNFTHLTLSCQIQIIENIIKSNLREKYVLIGSSMGGLVAALCVNLIDTYPAFKKIKKLVLLAPAFEFTERILKKDKNLLKEWKEKGFIDVEHYQWNKTLPLNYDLYKDAKKYEKLPLNRQFPVLIFHGINDETVPYIVSINYMKQNPKCQTILLNSDHSLKDQLSLIWDFTRLYLKI